LSNDDEPGDSRVRAADETEKNWNRRWFLQGLGLATGIVSAGALGDLVGAEPASATPVIATGLATTTGSVDVSASTTPAIAQRLQATSPTEASWISDVGLNVKAFGAQGDNSTNDTAAIQAAINAASAIVINTKSETVGGVVDFPPGIYLTNTLVLPGGVWLRGSGIGATLLRLAPNSPQPLTGPTNTPTNTDLIQGAQAYSLMGTNSPGGITNWQISDMVLDGNGTNNGAHAGAGLLVYGYAYTLRNVHIVNCAADGMYTEWSTQVAFPNSQANCCIDNLSIFNCSGYGLYWNGPHDAQLNNISAAAVGADGLHVTNNGAGLQAFNVHVSAVRGAGIYTAAHATYFLACVSDGQTGNAGWIIDAPDCVIIGGAIFNGSTTPLVNGLQIGQKNSVQGLVVRGLKIGLALGAVTNGLSFVMDGGGNDIDAFCSPNVTNPSTGKVNARTRTRLATPTNAGLVTPPPTVPASGSPFRNTSGVPMDVYIAPGNATITQIVVAGTPIAGVTGGLFRVPHGQQIRISYSGTTAPSWTWVGQ
jgi:hypothetical protein